MAIVYLPLGSQSASGTLVKTIVYQGTTVRVYDVPTDPRTGEQLDVRHLFYDITKMLKSGGEWARAVWKSQYGSRWYTELYKHCKLDAFGGWATGQAYWDGYTPTQKAHLNAVAPFQATWNEPGRIWLCLLQVLYFDTENLPIYPFDINDWEEGNISGATDFWSKDLSSAIQNGTFASDDAHLSYGGAWSSVSDALAYAGKYAKATGSLYPELSFYWYGASMQIGYVSDPAFGSMAVRIDGGTEVYFSQYSVSRAYGNVWQGPTIAKGLHFADIFRHATGDATLDKIVLSGKVPKTTIKEKPGVGGSVPAGSVMAYVGSSAPDGWLLLDGSSLARAAYPSLFSVIGTAYGAVDGVSFNLPDLRGRAVVGAGTGAGGGSSGSGTVPTGAALTARVLGDWFGGETHLLVSGEMPSHTHTQAAHTHTDAGHTHTQASHTHTDAGHTHTQAAHTHTDAGHNHTQDPHTHTLTVRSNAGAFGTNVLARGNTVGTTDPAGMTNVTATNQAASANLGNATPTINSGTASLGNATPTINNGTASLGNATPAINNTGGGGAHNNIQPSLVLNYIIKT